MAAWAEGALWFSTGAAEQKCANLRANPYVVPTTGCNPFGATAHRFRQSGQHR